MLFDFYYGEAEKMSPTVYEGLPIYSESDLISLIREKCDDDLAEAVQRYVDTLKAQAAPAPQQKDSDEDAYLAMLESRCTQLQDVEEEIKDIEDVLFDQLYNQKRTNRKTLDKICDRLDGLRESIHESL